MTRPRYDRNSFDADAWVAALEACVKARQITWRQVSDETGIGRDCLSRVLNRRNLPDAVALAVLSAWARINPTRYCSPSKGVLR